MIAIDTNILIYAHRKDSPFYKKADQVVTEIAQSGKAWTIPWNCVHEFLAIVTNPRVFKVPTPQADAIIQLQCWLECPTLQFINEQQGYEAILFDILAKSKIIGPQIHDARVAAVCLQNGIRTLWSADRDFSRVSGLEVVNPLV